MIPVNLFMGILFAAAALIWHPPQRLLVTLGLLYIFCLGVFAIIGRRREGPARLASAYLPLAWMLVAVVLLGFLYRYDRGGWIFYRATGLDTVIPEMHPSGDDSIAAFNAAYPFLPVEQRGRDTLRVRRGVYSIPRTVILPRGKVLFIEPGTELRFAAGRSLIAYGPVVARGTESELIRFVAAHPARKWGSVGIVRAAKSTFEYVVFENSRRARVNNVDFFAGLSVIAGDVEITRCQFLNSYGKDAVNVQYGTVLIRENLFRNAVKDGLDLDGGSGLIVGNRFINCGDDGIDLSENENIVVYDNQIYDRRGGSIGADVNLSEIKNRNILGFLEK